MSKEIIYDSNRVFDLLRLVEEQNDVDALKEIIGDDDDQLKLLEKYGVERYQEEFDLLTEMQAAAISGYEKFVFSKAVKKALMNRPLAYFIQTREAFYGRTLGDFPEPDGDSCYTSNGKFETNNIRYDFREATTEQILADCGKELPPKEYALDNYDDEYNQWLGECEEFVSENLYNQFKEEENEGVFSMQACEAICYWISEVNGSVDDFGNSRNTVVWIEDGNTHFKISTDIDTQEHILYDIKSNVTDAEMQELDKAQGDKIKIEAWIKEHCESTQKYF